MFKTLLEDGSSKALAVFVLISFELDSSVFLLLTFLERKLFFFASVGFFLATLPFFATPFLTPLMSFFAFLAFRIVFA
jgi:hypothetical protein